MITMTVVFLFLGLLLAWILLWALFLRIGLRWAKVQEVTALWVVFATIVVFVLQVMLGMVLGLAWPTAPRLFLNIGIADLVAAVIFPPFVIILFFKTSFFRALQAWLPTLIAPIIMVAFVMLVFRPFLVEAFFSPTNAMAPTLLGRHWQGTCELCASPAYCSPSDPPFDSVERPRMICRDNFHVTQPADHGDKVYAADRFLVAKFLMPQRWNLVVFRFPQNPSVLYVMRLVGLPGEQIMISDGQVWANGEMLTPPESMRGIEYQSESEYRLDEMWASPERPAKLGDDEYFVLGDFSAQASDSRYWEQGAAGHQPFAVPESHLVGVVTHTYWPPIRWRTFR